jgi:hypothetical protein
MPPTPKPNPGKPVAPAKPAAAAPAAKPAAPAAKAAPAAAAPAAKAPAPAAPAAPAAKAPPKAPKVVSADERRKLVTEAAYFIAQKRGFSGGNPVHDWLLAEKQVDETLRKG